MAEKNVTRKLAAIFYADVAGYSRLTGADEEATHRALVASLDAITATIEGRGGRVLHYAGDAILAEFASVVVAVACAVDVQRDLAARNHGLPDERKLLFRIGINLGDVIVDRDELYGDGVNVAARLESLAEPGGICISRKVLHEVRDKLEVGFEFLGDQAVKNIERPIPVYRVLMDPEAAGKVVGEARPGLRPPRPKSFAAVAAVTATAVATVVAASIAWWQPWQSPPPSAPAPAESVPLPLPDKPSIAVLPFTNMSNDTSQEYFVDGITEDLITDLSKISGLFVIARNSTFAYKGKSPDVRRVANELGVRYVLEGSVRRAGNQVRINVQLIDAATGGHLWADRYDGSLNDVFGLQDKVTRKIVAVLAVQLTAGEQERVAHKETENAEAYDAVLKGWEQFHQPRPDTLEKAISYFEKATELDPDYSQAYAALAATYLQIWKRYWFAILGPGALHEPRFRAEEFLEKAMRNPTPLALQVAAAMFSQQGRHDDAIANGERSIALDPNDADSFVALAGALNLAGRPDEALGLIERAMRLNPRYPPSYLYELSLARFGMEQFDKAVVSLEKAAALNPDDRWSSRLLLATYGHLGRSKDAAKIFEAAEKNWRGFDPLTVRGVAFWYPFKEPADAERLAEGLRKAGVPD